MSLVKRRAASARRQSTRRQFLQVEALEDRSVLAGNVMVMEAGGFVTILGDSRDNQLTITLSGTSGAQVTAQNGTTINGSANPFIIGNFASFLNVNMQGGNDSLTLNGTTTQQLRVSGASIINLGEGNDTVRFNNFSSATGLFLYGFGGNDTVEGAKITDSTVNGGLRVNGVVVMSMGSGNDNISLRNSAFNKTFFADGGTGNDTFDFRNNEFRSVTTISGSAGTDTFNNVGNTFTTPPFKTGIENNTTTQGVTANNDTATVAEGGNVSINVLTNDTALASTLSPGTVTIVTQPARGTVAVNATTGAVTYTNGGGEFASDSFTYTVRDANGNLSNTATVNVTVTPVNDLPVATADTFTVNEGSSTTFELGQNDTDAENRLNLGSIIITQQPTNGTVTVGTGGNVSYVANVGTATSDSFQYTIADQDGGTSLPATVSITINQTTTPPTISAIDDQTVNEDVATAALAFTVNDTQTSAANLAVTVSSNNTTLVPNANITLGGSGSNRTVLVTPAADQSGTATITVTVTDGDNETATETFVVTVNAVNDPPTISGATNVTTNEDTASSAMTIDVGDLETPNGLTVTASSSNPSVVANSGVSITGSGATRQIVVTPVGDQFGTSTITLTVSDGTATATQTFDVTVNSVNDLPTLAAIADVTAGVDTTLNPISLTFDDVETSGANLTFTATSDNSDLIANAGLQFVGAGDTRSLQISPEAGITGTANITVRVTDEAGDFAEQVFTVTIDSPPTISAIVDQTIVAGTSTGALNFTVGDTVTDPADLTLSASSSNTTLVPLANISFGGTGANRAVTVAPAAGLTGFSEITVTVTDASGLTATETFVLTVDPANTLPTISTVNDISVDEDVPISSFLITVNDGETAPVDLVVTASSDNTGVIANSGIQVAGSGSERTVTITQVPDAHGTVNITLTVDDGDGGAATETFTVVIASLNDPPIAGTTTATVAEGGTVSVDLGTISSDVDSALNIATGITITQQPANGNLAVNGDGTVSYTHSGTETITDSFQYTIADNQGNVSTAATINIAVTPANDAPVAVDDSNVGTYIIGSNTPVTITGNLLTNDSDVDTAAASLFISALESGAIGQEIQLTYGDLTIQADGSYSYTIDPTLVDAIVTDTDLTEELFDYTLSDGALTDLASLTLNLRIRTTP